MIEKRTQAMSWLEGLTQDDWPMYHSDSEVQEIAKAALALLEEQARQIDEISDEYIDLGREMAKQPKIVMCKDCKHKGQTICQEDGTNIIVCWNQGYGIHHPIDWFCADGENR